MCDHPSIIDPVHAAAQRQADAPALIASGRTLSYGELDACVEATAQRLRDLGGKEGTRIAIYAATGWQVLVVLLAAVRARRVACLLSTRQPVQTVGALVARVAAPLVITDRTDVVGHLPAEVHVAFLDVLVAGPRTLPAPPPLLLDQSATVVFTSGSTGEPKAVLHTLGNHVFSAKGSNANIPLVPGDRWLLALPLYHVGGLGIVFRCVLAGATMVLPERGLSTGEAVMNYSVTHLSLVATQLSRLLREKRALKGVRAMLLGGSALPPGLLDEAHTRGLPVYTTYGLTEMASQVTTTPPGASRAMLDTSGRVLPYRHLRVAEDGEILVRGKTLFAGYVEGAAVHRPLDAEGWFHTKDVGVLDAEGWLRVTGRKDHLFISGGENIQPEEIEHALGRIGGVQQAVVVPVPDAEFGQRPVAFVEGPVALDTLADKLEGQLPRFKIPVAFYPWPADAAPGMKPDRAALCRQATSLQEEKL